MFKAVAISALTILVCLVQAYLQTHKAQEAAKHTTPPIQFPSALPQKEYSQDLNPKTETHINTDVGVTCTPQKDPYQLATFWVNFALAVIGALGIVAAFKTLRKLERQTKATEKALVLAQRPRIVVRNFYFTGAGIQEGSVAGGQFHIANGGGTDATIIEIVCECFIAGQVLPMKRPYEDTIGEQLAQTLHPGTSITWMFALKENDRIKPQAQLIGSATRFLYVAGWIGYRDSIGIYRRTNFCRRHTTTKGERLSPIDDPNYEYAD